MVPGKRERELLCFPFSARRRSRRPDDERRGKRAKSREIEESKKLEFALRLHTISSRANGYSLSLSLSFPRERALSSASIAGAMPPRRRPWPALQIDVGEGGGFAGVVERKEEAKHVAAADQSANRAVASTTTTKSVRASYAEAARRSTSNSVSGSVMLSFCDDGRLKPSAFGAAIRAGREGASAMRPSEFSVSAVATTAAAEGARGAGGAAGAAAAAAAAPAAPQRQEKPSTSSRVGEANDGARREGAWHQVRDSRGGGRRRTRARPLALPFSRKKP